MLALEGCGNGGLSGVLDDINNILDKAPKYIGDISNVLSDPNLDPFVTRVRKVVALNKGITATTPPATAAVLAKAPGVGLIRYIPMMDAYIYAREHKWVVPAIVSAAIAITAGLGFGLGRLSKRCKKEA